MLVLIDGHNLIGKLSDISLSDHDDETQLLFKLRQYRARTGRSLFVFFDSGGGFKLGEKKKHGGITVQYAPSGKIADQLIIKRLRKAKNPRELMVVTSDRAIQRVARQVEARVVSSSDFAVTLNTTRQPKASQEPNLSDAEIDEWLSIFGDGD